MIVSCPKWHISLVSGHGPKIMIGVLVFPDFQLLDAAGPISVFEIAARFAGQPPSLKGLGGTPGGGADGGDLRTDAWLRANRGQAWHPCRQCLLGRLYPRRSGRARWPPRDHALAAHPAFCQRLSQDKAGGRPGFRPRRQYLE